VDSQQGTRVNVEPGKVVPGPRLEGRKGMEGWMRTTWMPYWQRVPTELQQQFFDEITDEYLKAHQGDFPLIHVAFGDNPPLTLVRNPRPAQ